MEGASILQAVPPFAGKHSKGVSGRSAVTRVSPDLSAKRFGDAGTEEKNEEGNRRLVRQSFTRVSSPMCIRPTRKGGSWSSGSSAGNGGEGLPTMGASGSPKALRETGEAREREQAFGSCIAGEDRSLERVCSRVRRSPNKGIRHCPETGRYRCRSRSAAFWSREAS